MEKLENGMMMKEKRKKKEKVNERHKLQTPHNITR